MHLINSFIGRFSSFLVALIALVSMPALGEVKNPTIIRLGYANVDFRETSDPVFVNSSVNLGRLSVESQETPLLSIGRQLDDQWAVEVLLPLAPLELKADGKNGVIDRLTMGTADIWPLAMTLQYSPFHAGRIRPYIGLGVNYTYINNEKMNGKTASLLGIDHIGSIKVKNSFGVVMQLGVDFPITEQLMINVSTSFIELGLDASGLLYSGGEKLDVSAKMELKTEPNLTVIGVTYRF